MKNEKGSVTLYVLVSMLFFLIIVMTAYVSASNKLQGQNEEIARIKASYEKDINDEALLQLYNRVTKTREWLPGSGTQEDTYKIYTIEDLVELSNRTNGGEDFTDKLVELMNDLDFKQDRSYANANRIDFGDVNNDGTVEALKTELTTGQGFPQIGTKLDLAFKGTFEGNDKYIRHLYINSTKNYNGHGLFGNSYTVQNLTVKDGYVRGGALTGGIVGRIIGGKIENCHNENTEVTLREGDSWYAGGIVGQASTNTEKIYKCSNTGNVGSSGQYVWNGGIMSGTGGIAGYVGQNVLVSSCYNSGIIEANGFFAGGIAGSNRKKCYIYRM